MQAGESNLEAESRGRSTVAAREASAPMRADLEQRFPKLHELVNGWEFSPEGSVKKSSFKTTRGKVRTILRAMAQGCGLGDEELVQQVRENIAEPLQKYFQAKFLEDPIDEPKTSPSDLNALMHFIDHLSSTESSPLQLQEGESLAECLRRLRQEALMHPIMEGWISGIEKPSTRDRMAGFGVRIFALAGELFELQLDYEREKEASEMLTEGRFEKGDEQAPPSSAAEVFIRRSAEFYKRHAAKLAADGIEGRSAMGINGARDAFFKYLHDSGLIPELPEGNKFRPKLRTRRRLSGAKKKPRTVLRKSTAKPKAPVLEVSKTEAGNGEVTPPKEAVQGKGVRNVQGEPKEALSLPPLLEARRRRAEAAAKAMQSESSVETVDAGGEKATGAPQIVEPPLVAEEFVLYRIVSKAFAQAKDGSRVIRSLEALLEQADRMKAAPLNYEQEQAAWVSRYKRDTETAATTKDTVTAIILERPEEAVTKLLSFFIDESSARAYDLAADLERIYKFLHNGNGGTIRAAQMTSFDGMLAYSIERQVSLAPVLSEWERRGAKSSQLEHLQRAFFLFARKLDSPLKMSEERESWESGAGESIALERLGPASRALFDLEAVLDHVQRAFSRGGKEGVFEGRMHVECFCSLYETFPKLAPEDGIGKLKQALGKEEFRIQQAQRRANARRSKGKSKRHRG